MNELLERESPRTVVPCPVCDGPAELRHRAWELRCDGCGVTVDIAPDEPDVRVPMVAPAWHARRRPQAALALTTL